MKIIVETTEKLFKLRKNRNMRRKQFRRFPRTELNSIPLRVFERASIWVMVGSFSNPYNCLSKKLQGGFFIAI